MIEENDSMVQNHSGPRLKKIHSTIASQKSFAKYFVGEQNKVSNLEIEHSISTALIEFIVKYMLQFCFENSMPHLSSTHQTNYR